MQPNILPQESNLLTKKTDWGGPFQWLQFCDKFQLPFLELLFGHFRRHSSRFAGRCSRCSLPLIVQCCGTPQNADNDYLSLAKFMRLGPLKSDSYCDSDDKTQPVQLLVKQRSGSQSVDRLAEAPQSFAHDSKHCNHPNPLLSRPNNQSESNRNNNHKAQCKS